MKITNKTQELLNKMNGYITTKDGSTNLLRQIRYGTGVAINYLLYKATISDYFELALYEKSRAEKLEYLMYPKALEFAVAVDSLDSMLKYCSKIKMYKALGYSIKRAQLYSTDCNYDSFTEYLRNNSPCVYKPDIADCGHGIELWTYDEEHNREMFRQFISRPAVLDQMIHQCKETAAFHPASVNSVRVYSLASPIGVELWGSFFRTGRSSSLVDNLGSGGLLAGINIETGIIDTPATDDTGREFAKHPDSGLAFEGTQIPRWRELLEFVEDVAAKFPLNYVGWDIAVCEDGFEILEANPNPMVHGIQTKFRGGVKKQYIELAKTMQGMKGEDK